MMNAGVSVWENIAGCYLASTLIYKPFVVYML